MENGKTIREETHDLKNEDTVQGKLQPEAMESHNEEEGFDAEKHVESYKEEDCANITHDEKIETPIQVNEIPVAINPADNQHEDENLFNLKNFLLQKINRHLSIFNFITLYSKDLVIMFRKIQDASFRKITNTLNQSKNFIKFFKDITLAYQKFSFDLAKANFMSIANIQDQILPQNLHSLIEKTQRSIANNFQNFSNVVQANIISKGPFLRVDEIYTRLAKLNKEISNKISAFESCKDEINKLFKGRFLKVFDDFKKCYNDDVAFNRSIVEKEDFLLIELDLVPAFNRFFLKSEAFLKDLQKLLSDMRLLVLDYVNLIKETIELYIRENSKIFTGDMSENFVIVKNFYESLNRESIDITCNLINLLSSSDDIQKFNKTFISYQTTMIKYNLVKEEVIYQDQNFRAELYLTMDDFINFLLPLNPTLINDDCNRLIKYHIEVKRDPGLFKSWKTCIIIVTLQNNVIFFDEEISPLKLIEFDSISRIKYRAKEDKKHKCKFELSGTRRNLFKSSYYHCFDAGSTEKLEYIAKLFSDSSVNNLAKQDSTGDVKKCEGTKLENVKIGDA